MTKKKEQEMSYYEMHKDEMNANSLRLYYERMARMTEEEMKEFKRKRSEYYKAWYKRKTSGKEPKKKIVLRPKKYVIKEITDVVFSFKD